MSEKIKNIEHLLDRSEEKKKNEEMERKQKIFELIGPFV